MPFQRRSAPAVLGRGGTGSVHAEKDDDLRRVVAVKRLDPELAKDDSCRRSFVLEACINATLEHPNIVPVYGLRSDEHGVPAIITQLARGVPLTHWLRDPSRPPGSRERLEEGLEIFLCVCNAVAYAHDRGVLHLDVKPDNVMVAGFGKTYLLDWSVARLANAARRGEEDAGTVGTPGYLSPEQARGDPSAIDERSDVFGLGAVLYEIVSGKRPYGDHRDLALLLRQARVGAVVSIEEATGGLAIAPELLDIVRSATAPQPALRCASAGELRRRVLEVARGRAPSFDRG